MNIFFTTLFISYFIAFEASAQLSQYTTGRLAYERFVDEYMRRSAKTASSESRYIIPVVVHVVYSDPDHRASLEQVYSEMDHLRKLYRRIPGTHGFGAGVDTRIEFELATLAPDGSPTNGVTFTQNPEYADLQVGPQPNADYAGSENLALKTLVGWDRNRYLNIWVVEKIRTLNDGGELAGYAQFPWENGVTTDGVVVSVERFGRSGVAGSKALNPYDYTTAKMLGHWLGLLNVYEPGGCSPGDCTQIGDRVCDTPPSYEIPKRPDQRINSCNLEPGIDLPDRTFNVMENCFLAAAPNQFTAGQAARARATLENSDLPRRYGLWQESNHAVTGVGLHGASHAEFSANNLFPCISARVNFIDYSRNVPRRYLWFFPGGVPPTSDLPNPVVSYAVAGQYDVALHTISVIDGQEIESINIKKNYIRVTDRRTGIPATVQNQREGFQITTPPATWGLENPDSVRTDSTGLTWRMHAQPPGSVNGAGGFGQSTACAVFPGYYYADFGQRDAMVTAYYDASNRVGIGVEFSYAYSPLIFERDNPNLLAIRRLYTDTLNIYYSNDCGETWILAWSKGGMDLMTTAAPAQTGPFIPNRDEWKRDTARLLLADRQPFVRLKFEAVSGWGNNIYLDDINVQAFFNCDTCCNSNCCMDTCRVSRPVLPDHDFKVYPNPAKDEVSVDISLSASEDLEIELTTLYGVRVATWGKESFPPGRSQRRLHVAGLPAGVYILRLLTPNAHLYSTKITLLPE